MEHIHFVDIALFIGLFLIATALLQIFTNKTSFPYTVLLLISGFVAQLVNHVFHLDIHFAIPPEFIFFFLLPILLFEAAMHINFHQFRLQFKTISFLATFGLLLSIFVVAAVLALALNLPLGVALLFGAIISATDPIAVLALFKTLGAPKRLSLVADGESMFNDATAVIAFRVISTYVVGTEIFGPTKLLPSAWDFVYIFFGSIALGLVLGYIFARIFEKIKNERVIITALTMALALGSFAGAEHFFHLSGVITCVMAGVTVGNFAKAKMKVRVIHFLEEFWEYLGFLSLSLVFFFATFTLDVGLFSQNVPALIIAVAAVLLARSVSIYVSAFLSNRLAFFKDEPNVPMSWQHILNWGGLRGVIPLVLVYSLPDEFAYKTLMLQFTLAALLFTLFINGLTIKGLLMKLGLHLPKKEEEIIKDEVKLFEISESRRKLEKLQKKEFDQKVISEFDRDLLKREEKIRRHLTVLSTPDEFYRSLQLEALAIERASLSDLFEKGRMSENVYYEFDSELDLQEDALEHPEVFKGRGIKRGGYLADGEKTFRKKIIDMRRFVLRYPLFSKLFHFNEVDLVKDRYSLLRARLFSSFEVLEYLDRVEELFSKSTQRTAISKVRKLQREFIVHNQNELRVIEKKYPQIVADYQRNVIQSILSESNNSHVHAPAH